LEVEGIDEMVHARLEGIGPRFLQDIVWIAEVARIRNKAEGDAGTVKLA
jgi:hypothetical protein